jgi:putative phosphoesterase
MAESPFFTAGVIADTHVPDRFNQISPDILTLFHQARVNSILHAGDISSPLVIETLERIAPVHAVRGNRDWAFGKSLPLNKELNLGGVAVGLTHGHGGLKRYLFEKVKWLRIGYDFEAYRSYLLELFPRSKVIVFGHTHRPENRWEDGRLIFNPGAAFPCKENGYHVQAGLLHIYAEGRVEAEIILLSDNPPPRAR